MRRIFTAFTIAVAALSLCLDPAFTEAVTTKKDQKTTQGSKSASSKSSPTAKKSTSGTSGKSAASKSKGSSVSKKSGTSKSSKPSKSSKASKSSKKRKKNPAFVQTNAEAQRKAEEALRKTEEALRKTQPTPPPPAGSNGSKAQELYEKGMDLGRQNNYADAL
ncbi:MAG: hypothetical protein ACOZEN_08200, partial [Thermodesulfobacteriota bacterium]